MKKPATLEGLVFGRLTVLARDPAYCRGGARWIVLCVCGVKRSIPGGSLRTGNTKSCGCLKRETHNRNKTRRSWLAAGQAVFNGLLAQYIRGAKSRGHSFELTKAEFKSIVESPCHYCGVPPYRKAISDEKARARRHNGNYIYTGVDRVDNSLGYLVKNCVPCCAVCNRAKYTMTYLEFMAYLHNLVLFRGDSTRETVPRSA